MIGKEIRMHRLQKGYSQSYMSYCLEISQNAYSKIEIGQTDITVSRVIQIAKILEIPAIDLLGPVIGAETLVMPLIRKNASEDMDKLVEAFWFETRSKKAL